MKKTLLTFGAMAFAMATPNLSAAPVCLNAPGTQAASVDENAAIQRYVMNAAAATMDNMADALEQSDGSSMSQAAVFIASLETMLDMPIDELPACHQAFVKESYAAARVHMGELKVVLELVKSGEMTEDEAMMKMAEITKASQADQAAIEAKYPESAKVLGLEASQKLAQQLMPELQRKAMPRVQAYFAAHPEEKLDQTHVMAVTFRIIGQLFREMAPAK